MGLFGNMFYGASSASLWTGNMIYTALQNAKTKKEVRELYNRASETNFKNRSVAIHIVRRVSLSATAEDMCCYEA